MRWPELITLVTTCSSVLREVLQPDMTPLPFGYRSVTMYFIKRNNIWAETPVQKRHRSFNFNIFGIVILIKIGYYITIKARRFGYGCNFMVDRDCGVYCS